MPRIVIYAHEAYLGSGAVHSLLMILARRPPAIDVLVVFPSMGDAVLAVEKTGAESLILPHYQLCGKPVNSPPGRYLCRAIRIKRQLQEWLRRVRGNRRLLGQHAKRIVAWRPDLIYTNTSVIPMGKLVASRLKLPHVLHVREFATLGLGLRRDPFALRLKALCSHSTVIVNSNATAAFVRREAPDAEPIIIYNGVECSSYRQEVGDSVSTGAARLLIAGRVSELKGQFDAVRALALVHLRHENVTLTVVGSGELEELQALVDREGVCHAVRIAGHCKDMAPHYAVHDIYLMCSRHEAFGLCTVEAMMHGLPVIGRVGPDCATGEIVVDRETGMHYSGGPDSLADAICEMLADRSRMREWGANGRRRVESMFGADRCAADVWSHIMGQIQKTETGQVV